MSRRGQCMVFSTGRRLPNLPAPWRTERRILRAPHWKVSTGLRAHSPSRLQRNCGGLQTDATGDRFEGPLHISQTPVEGEFGRFHDKFFQVGAHLFPVLIHGILREGKGQGEEKEDRSGDH